MPTRLAAFVVLLALLGAASAAIGAATRHETAEVRAEPTHAMEAGAAADGLAATGDGFTLEPQRTRFAVGRGDFRFRIVDAQGAPASDFTEEGGVRLHVIVVRRDLTG